MSIEGCKKILIIILIYGENLYQIVSRILNYFQLSDIDIVEVHYDMLSIYYGAHNILLFIFRDIQKISLHECL